jgi:hypothetical protein
MTFASDTDLLAYEPDLARTAWFVSQTLFTGTGTLEGATLTVAAGSLFAAGVMPAQLIVLNEPIAGSFPIVDVPDATHLVVSSMHQSITDDPAVPRPPARPEGTEDDSVTFHVRTFWAQRNIATELILHTAGIAPTDRAAVDSVVPSRALSRACALASLHMIFTALATTHEDSAALAQRGATYLREFRRALRGLVVELDTDGDGQSEIVRSLSVLRTHRF